MIITDASTGEERLAHRRNNVAGYSPRRRGENKPYLELATTVENWAYADDIKEQMEKWLESGAIELYRDCTGLSEAESMRGVYGILPWKMEPVKPRFIYRFVSRN